MAGASAAQKDQARERERRAWEMRQQGRTQDQIAQELEVDQSAVSRILSRVNKRLLAQLEDAVLEQKAEQSGQLDHVVSEAMEAWRRSCEPDGAADGDGEPTAPDGDPRFLEVALKALAHKRGVWGVDAPKRGEVSGTLQHDHKHTSSPSPTDAARLAALERLYASCLGSGDGSPSTVGQN